MATHRLPLDQDAPRIPMRHASRYMHLLLLMAALALSAVVYDFWRMSQAPSPTLDLPAGAIDPEPVPQTPPTNEQAP